MKFTTTITLLLALPFALAGPCAPGEVGIGIEDYWEIGTGPGGTGPENFNSVIFDSNCNTLDTAVGAYDYCSKPHWDNGWGLACAGSEVVSIGSPDHLWFPCYVPSDTICASFLYGVQTAAACCKPLD